ncbi:MAG TPA: hypothetical protein PK808_00320 [Polymorphobacter sp.]|nr:hypothetical protein [Polymorphobacter sp.]
MSISPYHDLGNAKPHYRGQRAFWGGIGMILVGLLALISYFVLPSVVTPAAVAAPVAAHASPR